MITKITRFNGIGNKTKNDLIKPLMQLITNYLIFDQFYLKKKQIVKLKKQLQSGGRI